jgi:hypothetical protein
MSSQPPRTPPEPEASAAPSPSPPVEAPAFARPSAEFYGTPPLIHYGALAIAVIAPATLLLPPRRLSVQNAILSFAGSWGANQVVYDFTGKSLYQRSAARWANFGSSLHALPPAAERTHELLKAEKEARRKRLVATPMQSQTSQDSQGRHTGASTQDSNKDGVLHKLWMGDEKEDWKEERLAKEREALEEGKGYWDIMSEHISDAFNPKGKKPPAADQPSAHPSKSSNDQNSSR